MLRLRLFELGVKNADLLLRGLDVTNRRDKDHLNRLERYLRWLDTTLWSWLYPKLEEYREHLLDNTELSLSSVNVHLSTIRARYRKMIENPSFETEVAAFLPEGMALDEKKELSQQLRAFIRDAIEPSKTSIKTDPKKTHYPRLSHAQISEIIRKPGLRDIVGKRDTAVIALLLSTGLRASEVGLLMLPDLRQESPQGLALRVPPADKSKSERLIPYGGMTAILDLIDAWITEANIVKGPVFRGFGSNSVSVRDYGITVRGVEKIVSSYPILIDTTETYLTPMVLRRTYARRLYEEGVSIERIQQYVGVGLSALYDYIGDTTRKSASEIVPNLYGIDASMISEGLKSGGLHFPDNIIDSD